MSAAVNEVATIVQIREAPDEVLLRDIAEFQCREASWYSTTFELTLCSFCFATVSASDGRLVAVASIQASSQNNYWVGNVVVARKYRRQGIASTVLSQLINHTKRERGPSDVVLLATPVGLSMYGRLGFLAVDSIVATEYERPAIPLPDIPQDDAVLVSAANLSWELDFVKALQLDYECTGLRRSALLKAIFERDRICAVVKVDSEVTAAAWGRRTAPLGPENQPYLFIGPVIAKSPRDAIRVTAEVLRMERRSRKSANRDLCLRATVISLFKDKREASRRAFETLGFEKEYDMAYMVKRIRDNDSDAKSSLDLTKASSDYYALAGWDLG